MKKKLLLNSLLAIITFNVSVLSAQTVSDYVFSTSSGTFTAISGGTSMSVSSGSADDGVYTNIPIGFKFIYLNNVYKKCYASTNGCLSFSSAFSASAANDLSNSSYASTNLIAPLWDDLDMASGSFSYKSELIGTDSVFTAQWLNVEWNYAANTAVISFQVKLYKNSSKIEFIYRQEAGTVSSGGSASIGICQDYTSYQSLSSSLNTATASSTTSTNNINTKPANGQVFTFTPPTPVIISTLPYSENFDGATDNGWVSAKTNNGYVNDWVRGTPAKTNINAAYSGTKAWVTKLTGNYSSNGDGYVMSPICDFSSLSSDPILRFRHKFINGVAFSSVYEGGNVEIQINGGTWTALDDNVGTASSYNTSNSAAWYNHNGIAKIFGANSNTYNTQSSGWIQSATPLTGAAGQDNVRFRFRFRSYSFGGPTPDEGWVFDDVEVLTSIVPTVANNSSSNSYGSTEATLNATIGFNGGAIITASGFVMGSSSNPTIGGTGVTNSSTSPVVTSGSYNKTITGLSEGTKYYFRTYATNSAGTAYSAQDSFYTKIAALPYSEDFEGASANAWASGLTTSGWLNKWGLGTPSGKTKLTAPYSGTKAWVTNLTGPYGASNDGYVVSPAFDFSALTINPILRFRHKFEALYGMEGGTVEISINGGTWNTLDANMGTGTNYNTSNSKSWYNDPNNTFVSTSTGYGSQASGWIQSATLLTGAAGQSNVRFRFRFRSYLSGGSNFSDGWMFDDVEVYEVVAPTTDASNVSLSNITNTSIQLDWTNGNGDARIVVARPATAAEVTPTNLTAYTANAAFGSGNTTGTDNFVVYNGTGSTVTVTGLSNNTNYVFTVYEYNGSNMHVVYSSGASKNGMTPVKLTQFTATASNNDVILNWTTTSESNNNGFDVERSVDGAIFTKVDFVKGAGTTSTIQNYVSVDANAFNKTNANTLYYRLKQVDFNGNFEYSSSVSVTNKNDEKTTVNVYPNPFIEGLTVTIPSAIDQQVVISIKDIQGKLLNTKNTSCIKGINTIYLNELSDLKEGVYFMKIDLSDHTSTAIKIVKLN